MKFILALFPFLLISCASAISHAPVLVHDIKGCTDAGSFGAICTTTLSHTRTKVDAVTWGSQRIGMICVSSEDFTDIFTTEEQLCTELKVCDYETQQKIMGMKTEINMLIKAGQNAQKLYGK